MKLEKKHYWIIGTLAVVTTVGVVLYVRNKKKKAKDLIVNDKQDSNSHFIEESNKSDEVLKRDEVTGDLFPLQYGAVNDSVASLQKYINSTSPSELKKLGIFPLRIDGKWEDKTEAGVLACSVLKRNSIDKDSFNRISRDLSTANIK
jgi:hypothetical protein